MRLLVDADACPNVKEITELALDTKTELILYCDYSHNLQNDYAEIVKTDIGYQSVDVLLVNDCSCGDIVITQDYGVAALVLAKGSISIHPSGLIYTTDEIDQMLMERHIHGKLRRQNCHVKGPKKRTKQEEAYFIDQLAQLIKS